MSAADYALGTAFCFVWFSWILFFDPRGGRMTFTPVNVVIAAIVAVGWLPLVAWALFKWIVLGSVNAWQRVRAKKPPGQP